MALCSENVKKRKWKWRKAEKEKKKRKTSSLYLLKRKLKEGKSAWQKISGKLSKEGKLLSWKLIRAGWLKEGKEGYKESLINIYEEKGKSIPLPGKYIIWRKKEEKEAYVHQKAYNIMWKACLKKKKTWRREKRRDSSAVTWQWGK